MTKTITVKGVGKASAKPDFVVLSMSLESCSMDYAAAMDKAADSIAQLNEALAKAGFEKDSVKTTSFNVGTVYDSQRQNDGSTKRVFNGYEVSHSLKVSFDFDSARLTKAISAVGDCIAHPQLNIRFTVKDSAAINEQMLRSATANAERTADILCEASGMRLGALLNITYNWGELDIYSNTRYSVSEDCVVGACANSIEFEPDDINVSDSATFVWEIER